MPINHHAALTKGLYMWYAAWYRIEQNIIFIFQFKGPTRGKKKSAQQHICLDNTMKMHPTVHRGKESLTHEMQMSTLEGTF
jgi:hypothetical protein